MSSGLLIFEGEDLDFRTRTKFVQQTHKQHFDLQVRERQELQRTSEREDLQRHAEYMQMNSLFGQMEQDYRRQYRSKLEDIQNANKTLARAKRELQRKQRQEQIEEDNKLLAELTKRRSLSLKPAFAQ